MKRDRGAIAYLVGVGFGPVIVLVASLLIATLVGCAPAVAPPPIPPPINYLFKEIFWSSSPDPNATPPRPAPHSCAINVFMPTDATLRAQYRPVDSFWYANGWAFWTACVIAARDSGRALPVFKDGGFPNEAKIDPFFRFYLETAPVLGTGSGLYDSLRAANGTFWRVSYIEASG